MKAQLSNTDYELINRWRLTGRTAFIYPKKALISLNGTRYDYTTAINRIKEFVSNQN